MSAPEDFLRFPTLDDARIARIEAPSSREMHSLYGDLILEIIGMDVEINDKIRKAASLVLNARFFEIPDAQVGSEIWLMGASAIFTSDRTMIREIAENEKGQTVPDEELPYTIGYPLTGSESIQGFFSTFSTGPVIDVHSDYGNNLDFSFCVNVENLAMKSSSDEQPEFLVGNWLIVMGNQPAIGLVS
jgi:hypothetical protein